MEDEREDVTIKSIVSATTREPGVLIRLGDVYRTVTVTSAREVAQWLLEAAEAAIQDAFLANWGKEMMQLSDEQTVALLIEFRKWRSEQGVDRER